MESKKAVSNFAYIHQLKRIGVNVDNNMLLIGDSGSGKTFMVTEISKILNVPFVLFDGSRTVKSGIVGNCIDDAIISLSKHIDNIDKSKLEGIIFVDEFDKIKDQNIRFEILSLLDPKTKKSHTIRVENNPKEYVQKTYNLEKVSFILGGVFEALHEKNNTVINPFGNNTVSIENNDIKYSLLKKGILEKEVLGRINFVSVFDPVSKEMLLESLEKRIGIMAELEHFFDYHNIKLELSEKTKIKIVTEAYDSNTGFRGISYSLQKKLDDILFDIDKYMGKTIQI